MDYCAFRRLKKDVSADEFSGLLGSSTTTGAAGGAAARLGWARRCADGDGLLAEAAGG